MMSILETLQGYSYFQVDKRSEIEDDGQVASEENVVNKKVKPVLLGGDQLSTTIWHNVLKADRVNSHLREYSQL